MRTDVRKNETWDTTLRRRPFLRLKALHGEQKLKRPRGACDRDLPIARSRDRADRVRAIGGRRALGDTPRVFQEREICPLPRPIDALGEVTEVKGSAIVASIRGLREEGYYDRYLASLKPALRESIPFITAGQWVPLAEAIEHYRACDAMGLPLFENVRLGDKMAQRMNSNFVATIATIARATGVTPFTLLAFSHRAFASAFRGGGGVRVVALGEREARFEMHHNPLLSVPWHRHGWCGTIRTNLLPVCKTCLVTELAYDDANAAYRVVWA
jgi:hypothetical protein